MATIDSKQIPEQLRLDNQVCFPLYSAANEVVRAYRPHLAEYDLSYLQYLVLMVLWEANELEVKALGAKLNLDSGTLSPLLKRMEAKGLVLRKRGRIDERVRLISTTQKGEEIRHAATDIPQRVACQLGLDIDELTVLKRLCEKVLSVG
ncbi:MarR family transcriptional regulator [uncultured Umboniibacter sp.]|uniref:MarR family winged helix-turn-helix transcriptional regulator n=1 Tax=uncultured Umboniibacter sp. TaxID=1798917 RepID=UPI00262BFE53|nr:MarR family transcriptional regulator [uncultured Umboniibacter sp.]